MLNFFRKSNYACAFYIICWWWYGAGSWNPFSCKQRTCLSYMVDTSVWLMVMWQPKEPGHQQPCYTWCHFDKIFIIGCTRRCHNDNVRCSQWWKFFQNDVISTSVYWLICTGMFQSEHQKGVKICSILTQNTGCAIFLLRSSPSLLLVQNPGHTVNTRHCPVTSPYCNNRKDSS